MHAAYEEPGVERVVYSGPPANLCLSFRCRRAGMSEAQIAAAIEERAAARAAKDYAAADAVRGICCEAALPHDSISKHATRLVDPLTHISPPSALPSPPGLPSGAVAARGGGHPVHGHPAGHGVEAGAAAAHCRGGGGRRGWVLCRASCIQIDVDYVPLQLGNC